MEVGERSREFLYRGGRLKGEGGRGGHGGRLGAKGTESSTCVRVADLHEDKSI